jgi:GT2 family glycosyltransferase
MKRIAFIAVNYNNSGFTLEYANSILSIDRNGWQADILIVDNASDTDDFTSLEKNLSLVDGVTLIRSTSNLGYFGGLNLGLEKLEKENYNYILIGNNDLTFEKTFLSELNHIHLTSDILVLAPDVVTVNGFHQNPLCAERMSMFRKWGLRLYYTNYYYGRFTYHVVQFLKKQIKPNRKLMESRTIYMGIGAAYILTPEFFKHFPKLWDDVFLWSEEALLAGQIDSVKGKMLYCPGLIIHHAENTSVKKIPSRKTYEMARISFLKTFRYY